MLVSELFKRLSYGPFSNLAIGNEGDGTILEARKPQVISNANDAMVRLYSRFVLSEKEVVVEQRELNTLYTISSKNAVSTLDTNPAPGNPAYIIDSEAEPFLDDIIKISSVYTDEGVQLPLNRDHDPKSVFTPQVNVLQVPVPIQGKPLYVIYQAKPIPLTIPAVDAEVLEVPTVLEGALLHYISYLTFSAMNGQEHTAKAQEHLGIYDAVCREVIENDLVSSSLSLLNTKLEDRGFV
jgi:hypothetical protein